MPVVALKGGSKISPWFPWVPSAWARVYVEASAPVDIYISNPEHAAGIVSVETAGRFGSAILIRNARWQLDEKINLAPNWEATGWNLTIGHPGGHNEVIAVYYVVFPA